MKENDLVIGGERDGDAVAAEDGAGVAAVRDDDFVRRDDGDDGGGSDGVAVGSLELAPAGEGLVALAPAINLVVHASESVLHRQLPLQILARAVNLFIHDLV